MSKPTVAVYKFSSCDGCQLSILNLEDELLDLVGAIEIAYFLEARRRILPGPYDIALVEGLDYHAPRSRTHPGDSQASKNISCTWHLCYCRRDPGIAELRKPGRTGPGCIRTP